MRPSQTSTMECFAKIFSDFWASTISKKTSSQIFDKVVNTYLKIKLLLVSVLLPWVYSAHYVDTKALLSIFASNFSEIKRIN